MKEADEIRFGKQRGLALQLCEIAHSRFQQLFVPGNFRHEQIAEVGQQVAAEVPQVVTAHDDVVDNGDCGRRTVRGDAVDDARENVRPGDAERRLDVLFFDRRAGKADHLVQRRLRVAHRAFTGARDLPQRVIRN